jgi:phospholipid/cholesterol/gamma-HCH transport system substrate-binding protein
VARIPADTRARLLPKTLFGEKEVSLVFEDRPGAEPLPDGDVISQDSSETARELTTALDNFLPLQALRPEQISTTLNALSTTLRGRGDRPASSSPRRWASSPTRCPTSPSCCSDRWPAARSSAPPDAARRGGPRGGCAVPSWR